MKKIYKKVLIVVIMIYFVFTLISQQRTLNTYRTAEKEYTKKLSQAEETNKELAKTKQNISSLDYIEQMAREKLDMYLPNERVYIDVEK